jgi:hypothetical protein
MTNWRRKFDEPIPLPDGGKLVTLLDAGRHIQGLLKKIHDRPEWQTATALLLSAAEEGGPVMFANIALMRALNAGKPAPAAAARKKSCR